MAAPDPPSEPHATGEPSAPRPRPRRSDRARQVFVAPWSRTRARRVRVVALVLGVVGPLLGTAFALLLVPAQPADVLDLDAQQEGVLDVQATVRGIDASTGEMSLQLVVKRSATLDPEAPDGDIFGADGSLVEDLTVLVNDANGNDQHLMPAGAPLGTVVMTAALTDSRATRYPLDRYRTVVAVVVRREDDRPLPIRMSLRASDPGFNLDVIDDLSGREAAIVELRVARRATVIGWAGFFVLVCWLLALSAASIGWTTVVHGIAAPAWAWGFSIGVLFALPPLRNALPGNPPSGSLVDLAAFYWAVGIVALTLVAMIGSWNIRVRRAPDQPDAPPPRI